MNVEFMTNSAIIDLLRIIGLLALAYTGFKFVAALIDPTEKSLLSATNTWIFGVVLILMIVLGASSNQPKFKIDNPSAPVYKEEKVINTPEPRFEKNEHFVPLKD